MNKTIFTFLTLAFLGLSTTYAQVGIGTITPHASAMLDIESTDKGFLPPRMTTTERDAIVNLEKGLTIYNTSVKCLQWWNGKGWYDGCDGSTFVKPQEGGSFTNGFENNTTCATKLISVSPCTPAELANGINGGSLGNKHANGTGGAYSVVQIGDQCWMAENIDVNPAGSPTWSNSADVGWYGYYNNTYQTAGEGTLMQWSAAMNGATDERAQGVCPTGWHVPSDCEWMYLENELGMTVADQLDAGWRSSGTVGTQLKSGGSSGFNGRLTGGRSINSTFVDRAIHDYLWNSSEFSSTQTGRRLLKNTESGVRRDVGSDKIFGLSVRCIKD